MKFQSLQCHTVSSVSIALISYFGILFLKQKVVKSRSSDVPKHKYVTPAIFILTIAFVIE